MTGTTLTPGTRVKITGSDFGPEGLTAALSLVYNYRPGIVGTVAAFPEIAAPEEETYRERGVVPFVRDGDNPEFVLPVLASALTILDGEPENGGALKVGDSVVRIGPHVVDVGTDDEEDFGDEESDLGDEAVVVGDHFDGDLAVKWTSGRNSGTVSSITAKSLRRVDQTDALKVDTGTAA